MDNIDTYLKSCSPDNDVYTYSFNKNEVDHINRALQRYDLVKEIKRVLNEQHGDIIEYKLNIIHKIDDMSKNKSAEYLKACSDIIKMIVDGE